jgi:hypothetical protein
MLQERHRRYQTYRRAFTGENERGSRTCQQYLKEIATNHVGCTMQEIRRTSAELPKYENS